MAGNSSDGLGEAFFEQMLAMPSSFSNPEGTGYGRAGAVDLGPMPMVLQFQMRSSMNPVDGSGSNGSGLRRVESFGIGMPNGMNLEDGFMRHDQEIGRSFQFTDGIAEGNNRHPQYHHQMMMYHNSNTTCSPSSSNPAMTGMKMQMQMQMQSFPHQPLAPDSVAAKPAPQPPAIRPRVRARRGQATDPHSIAERLRRERIAERMKALQELVPSANKTDRAALLDEIVDYVKFLRLQVKVLSMSRLGGAGAVAQLVSDVPLSTDEPDGAGSGINQQAWGNWSNDETEQQLVKIMEEDVGSAMQFLQSKALCIMPISLVYAIFRNPQSNAAAVIKSESNHFP